MKKQYTPEALLKEMTRLCSANIPWIERDLTKENFNRGQFRLMESPLQFLIRNKLIKDPNNLPFRWDIAYGAGHAPALYEDGIFPETIFENYGFKYPDIQHSSEQEEIKKFDNSDLIPLDKSIYLNTSEQKVNNSIDESALFSVLGKQLGERMNNNPYEFFLKKLNTDEHWKFGLFTALVLHGHSDNEKETAYAIFDSMNNSMGGKCAFDPKKVDISNAKYRISPDIHGTYLKNLNKHTAWSNVYFMDLFSQAKTRGVLSTAMFGWVKAFDRTLWYALSQTGRDVCCAEAAGVWSHYHAEEIAGHSLDSPFMDIAVEGFYNEMTMEGWLPKNSQYKAK